MGQSQSEATDHPAVVRGLPLVETRHQVGLNGFRVAEAAGGQKAGEVGGKLAVQSLVQAEQSGLQTAVEPLAGGDTDFPDPAVLQDGKHAA